MLNHLGIKHNTGTPLNVQPNRTNNEVPTDESWTSLMLCVEIMLLLICSSLMKQCANAKKKKTNFQKWKTKSLAPCASINVTFNCYTLFCAFAEIFELLLLWKHCSNIELNNLNKLSSIVWHKKSSLFHMIGSICQS